MHYIQGRSNKVLQRKKLRPRLMSGVTLHCNVVERKAPRQVLNMAQKYIEIIHKRYSIVTCK